MPRDETLTDKPTYRVRLTDRACEAAHFPKAELNPDRAKRRNQRLEIRDTKCEGLELRVTPSQAKTWAFRYRRRSDGSKRTMTLGSFPECNVEKARYLAGKARTVVSEGADPAAGIQQRKAAPTFKDVVEDWQKNHAESNRSKRVRADDQSMLDRYILPKIGGMKVHDIGRRELSAMVNGIRGAIDTRKGRLKGNAEPRKLTHRPNRVFELARAILRWSLGQGIITIDPTAGMKRPLKKEAVRERELSPDEIRTFWQNVDQLPSTPALHLALKLALATAQRIGEVCGIRKSELTLDGPAPVWVIPRERTKNSQGHRVPLSPIAVALIREALALQTARAADGVEPPLDGESDSPWLFPARHKRDKSKGPILPGAAATAMFRGRSRLGVDHFRVHDLRRTAATRMAEMGINPYTISLVLNHVSTSKSTITGKVYVQYSFDKEKREALEAWGARLEKIVAGNDAANVVTLPVRAGTG